MTILISFLIGLTGGFFLALKKKSPASRIKETSPENTAIRPPLPNLELKGLAPELKTSILEKKILYEEELALIFKMGRDMFSSVSLDNIAKSIAETVNKIINAEICTILLEDKITGQLVPIFTQGVAQELVEKMSLKKGEGISGWVALRNQTVVNNDFDTDDWLRQQNRKEYFVRNLVSIPLATKERTIGVLNLSNKKTGQPFTDDEVEFLKGLAMQSSIALQNAILYEQIQDSYLNTISTLAFALDARDSYTREHSENVTKYAVAIAQELHLMPTEIERIRRAGLLHDIGKIGIRDGVLLKSSVLSDDEYTDIKRHPIKGEAIVSALPFLKEEAKMIRHHHERYDGKGYPDGIRGANIEKGAAILAVADSFDAMIEDRVYRKALGFQAACEELKQNKSKQFDPEAVDAFLRVLAANPLLK